MANCGKVEQICISQVTITLTEDFIDSSVTLKTVLSFMLHVSMI